MRLTTWTREINPADHSVDVYIGAGPPLDLHGITAVSVGPETFGPVMSPALLGGCPITPDLPWSVPRLDIRWPPNMWTN